MTDTEQFDEREQRAWFGFLTMQEDLRRHINRQLLEDSGLSLSDFSVLSALVQQPDGALRVFELVSLLRWERTRLIHQVSRMVSRELLERRPAAEDSRGSRVALTERGREAVRQATPLHLRDVRRTFFDAISPRQIDMLAALSEAVLDSIADQERNNQ
ncbi:MarR family winged helix-turn-helix transcriptional regulator [Actinoplanes sp. TRM 88003]|uniref:MarR family winged helix-turn-helix transcriptional regulator n=1 Tax=Paractinoplanes aksuensis TaxID=2939490 RepID=A0ABT1E4F5_9ACTN|nr:MarR family winged helix-turn-helix transcriptional regulator [Actinoplanes aksuensis]MCO8277999.1 MarR family winged helix-turn-helix transcriptional regulator [Actinoplanes aksuensis]